jgi:hypothetical protein
MSRILGRAFFAVTMATLLVGAMPALAQKQNDQGENNNDQGERTTSRSRSVPEFDPTTVGAIAAILVGGGALLARRRRR